MIGQQTVWRSCPLWLMLITALMHQMGAAEEKSPLKFTRAPYADNAVVEQTWSRTMELEVFDVQNGDKKLGSNKIAETGKKRVVVQYFGGAAPAVLKISYEQFEEGPPDVRKVADVVGKTYFLDARQPKEIKVFEPQAQEPPLLERVLIQACNEDLLSLSPLAEKLVSRSLAAGDTIRLGEDDVKSLFNSMCDLGTAQQGTMELTYRGSEAGLAMFDARQSITEKSEGAEGGFELTGKLRVDPQGCRVAAYDVAGRMAMIRKRKDQQGNPRHFRVSGPMTIKLSAKNRPADAQ